MAAKVKVTMLAVGQGMSNLIEVYDANGKMEQLMLVDCGGDGAQYPHVRDCIWRILLAMKKRAMAMGKSSEHRHIDLVVLSHQDKDHHSIIKEILKQQSKGTVSVGEYWKFDEWYCRPRRSYIECRDAIKAVTDADNVCTLPDGSAYGEDGTLLWHLYASDKVCLTYLYANARGGDSNNTVSAVIQLELRFPGKPIYRFLFPGDPTTQTMNLISGLTLPKGYEIDYMSAPHHGSIITCDRNSLDAFLAKLQVREMVVSAGENNGYGHPHKTFMEIAESKIRSKCEAHSCYYNTTDGRDDRKYGIKKTAKSLYTTFVPEIQYIGGAIKGAYEHYIYEMSAKGMEESTASIEKHAGTPYNLAEHNVQEQSRPWRAVAKPGLAERR